MKAIMNYNDFCHNLNKRLFDGSRKGLLESIAANPTPTPSPTPGPTATPYFTPDPGNMTYEEDN